MEKDRFGGRRKRSNSWVKKLQLEFVSKINILTEENHTMTAKRQKNWETISSQEHLLITNQNRTCFGKKTLLEKALENLCNETSNEPIAAPYKTNEKTRTKTSAFSLNFYHLTKRSVIFLPIIKSSEKSIFFS